MQYFKFVPEGTKECVVEAWLQEDGKEHAAVLICPGGGYEHVSEREAEPIARCYVAAGFHAFVITYSVCEKAKGFEPLCQVASAMAHIRAKAKEWNVNADKIAISGFSAGGHLAASMGILYAKDEFRNVFGRDEDVRPNAMILSYPVILADAFAHEGSIKNVSGCEPGTEGYEWFGLAQHVDEKTPPTFLWHTAEDDCVPVENSLMLAAALSKYKVPFELHVFPEGGHGMSVCTEEVGTPSEYNARWMEWSIVWLKKVFGVEE